MMHGTTISYCILPLAECSIGGVCASFVPLLMIYLSLLQEKNENIVAATKSSMVIFLMFWYMILIF